MKLIAPYWAKWKRLSAGVCRWAAVPAVCYLELLFHYWIGGSFTPSLFFTLIGYAICVGGVVNILAALMPEKIAKPFVSVLLFLFTAIMMVEFLIGDAYYNYMRPALVLVSAGGVITDYSDTMFDMIITNWWRILIALLPFLLTVFSGKEEKAPEKKQFIAASLAGSLIGLALGFAGLSAHNGGLATFVPQYDFNTCIKRNGITVSMYMELSGLGTQAEGLMMDIPDFELVPVLETTAATEAVTEPTVAETEAAEMKATEAPTTVPTEAPTKPAATEPTASTEPTAKTVKPVAVAETIAATEPTVVTTEAATEPTEVSSEPTETVTAATEESLPVEPVTEATTEPVTEATTAPTETTPPEPSTEATEVTEEPAPTEIEESLPTEPVTEAATEPETEPVTEPETEPTTEPTEEPKVFGPHVIDGLDFGTLAEKETEPTRKKLYSYINALPPAMENEYTGLFEGKNLILITAESFNYALIDPELTPTLYRLATQGIEFTNYYQPLWTGNTSGGELVNLSGLALNCEMITYTNQKPFNTIGRQLMNLGYFSRAYHDNGYYFYDRDKTHANLGYEQYIGIGNGLEEGVQDVWPASDQEMFDYTLPLYIDQQPFSIYYMTCSAHCRYNTIGHAQAKKNWDLVQDLPYSDALKAYIASNMELEKGLTSLVAQLEEAGIADNTVICMTSDHFPYGLGTAWGNDHNCLAELYGMQKYDNFQRDKNTLIIWSGCLEGLELQVDAPVCSVDILPTLSNLFGVEYDSRLSVGRDVMGTEEAISFWPDYSWITELGKYDSTIPAFIPFTDDIPEGYAERISAIVRNRISFSRSVQNCDFFRSIQKEMGLEY